MIKGKTIEKKILPRYYDKVRRHEKMFEIRKDEDNIQVGDAIVLREWNGKDYTGHQTKREVTYVLRGDEAVEYGVKDGYCIIGLQIPGYDFIITPVVGNERIVNCRDCMYWTDEYVKQNDGRCRQYRGDEPDALGVKHSVSISVGINMGAMCRYEHNRGWEQDHCTFRNPEDFCSRGRLRPTSYEEWHGIVDGYYPEGWIYEKSE